MPDDLSGSLAQLWRPAFPAADLVGLAAGQFDPLPVWKGAEGPRFRIVISPGALAIESHDPARAERAHERQVHADRREADVLGSYLAEHGEFPDRPSRSEITGWSRRSRARMVRRLCELDYGPLLAAGVLPAMVTLTYPGDWLPVAPDGRAVKRHLAAFRRRWARTWGSQPLAVWKLEFQHRGAPHVHLLMVPPMGLTPAGQPFREWLSATWAAIVNHQDPEQRRRHQLAGTGVDYAEGLRATDPRRVAVYFTKHGTFSAKEYQNEVPAEWQAPGQGPGRFWGVWGLSRCTAAVEIDPHEATSAARVMRRWARAQGTTRQTTARRVDVRTGLIHYRRVRRRVRRMGRGRGWVSLNDAPAFASALARYLSAEGVAVSRRNSHEAKRQRRAERAAAQDRPPDQPLAEVHDFGEVYDLAMRGERLPCGCDAHELLHEFMEDGPPAEP